jgi:uncharacterized delta-60 repeat protein
MDTAAVQPDGKILLGGLFYTVDGQERDSLARLLPDGTLESNAEFNYGRVGGSVGAFAVQPDGKIIVAGSYTEIGNSGNRYLDRLNNNGTVDESFDARGLDGRINSLIAQPDGKIVIAGGFAEYGDNDVPAPGIARLMGDGSLESSLTFNPGTGPVGLMMGLTPQPDGRILICGDFTAFSGAPRNRIARLQPDGTLEGFNSFLAGSGANNYVSCTAVQPDGRIIVGGRFTMFDNQPRNRIARLQPDGSLESTFAFNPGTGPSDIVTSIALQADGKILVAGIFSTVNGQPRRRLARLLPDGTLESSETFNVGTGADDYAHGVTLQADGKILLYGIFDNFNGQPRNLIARLYNDPATESLTIVSPGEIRWLRGGSAPEVRDVTFELSTDGGASWTRLVDGERTTGGWGTTGFTLPESGRIRARGRTACGHYNGSSGLVESTLAFPPVNLTLASFSITPSPVFAAWVIQTTAHGGPGAAFARMFLESSDTLEEWKVLTEKTADVGGSASFQFTDLAATGPRRYYRVRMQ